MRKVEYGGHQLRVSLAKGHSVFSVTTADIQYVVAGTDDLAIRADLTGASGTTSYGAGAALAAHLLAHPENVGRLQVLPVHEVAA